MNFQLLEKSGLRISEIALGAMTFGTDMAWGAAKEESRRVFDGYVEAGGNFIDTADGYQNGNSERIVGEFIAGQRERFVIATKYAFSKRPGRSEFRRQSPEKHGAGARRKPETGGR